MATGFPYETVSLDSKQRQIRLLSFKLSRDSKASDPVVCMTTRISLDDALLTEYRAVSYTWGKSKERRDITIDGYLVSIGENAYNALRTLRLHPIAGAGSEWEIRMWIDAVCIDQSSTTERNWQVGMMGQVYSSAAEVLVYLDGDNGYAKETFALIQHVYDHCESITKPLGERPSSSELLGDTERKHPTFLSTTPAGSVPNAKDDGSFLSKRQWDLISDLYGHAWFSRIWIIQEVLLASHAVCYYGEYAFLMRVVLVAASWLVRGNCFLQHDRLLDTHIQAARQMLDMKMHKLTLEAVLISTKRFHSSEPRDRIYGVLGLVCDGDEHAGHKPDYNKRLMEVYRDATRTAMRSASSLNLLTLAGKERQKDHAEFPSWVPEYHLGHSMFSVPGPDGFRYIPAQLYDEMYEGNVLSVGGAYIDHLRDIGPILRKDPPISEYYGWLWEQLERLRHETNLSLDELACVFACGTDSGHNIIEPNDPFFDSFHYFMECIQSPPAEGPAWWRENGRTTEFIFASYKSFQRIWCVTTGGRVGICPAVAEYGDVVCHLFGSDHLHLLRRDGSGWILLGEVFIYDIENSYPEDAKTLRFDIH